MSSARGKGAAQLIRMLAIGCLCLCAWTAFGLEPSSDAATAFDAALATISATAFRTHMELLASDAMQGREAGTAGYVQAARYVADQFAAAGLEPMGEHGFLQPVPLLTSRIVPDGTTLTLHCAGKEESFRFGEEFVCGGSFAAREEVVSAPLHFVGYGIQAPEYAHDDYADADVSGKIIVVLSGAPPHFATDQRAFYSSMAIKRALAVERGAVGILIVRTPPDQRRTPWERVLSGVGSAQMLWSQADGTPNEGFPSLKGEGTLSEGGAARLFRLCGQELTALIARHEAGSTGGFSLACAATLRRASIRGATSSPNVLGLLRGSDPTLAGETILLTAHLDHLGVRRAADGDSIHNGAYDNAAGVATIIEVARAAAIGAPRRSFLFAALTAEEKGLQGSSYLSHHLPVPIERVVANINIDMPYLGFPIADIEGLGVEHSTLHASLSRATERLGLALTPDPRPEQVRFIRSDQFSFVKLGIPALNLKPGSRSSDAAIDGTKALDAFLQDHYHRASDDLSLAFSPEAAERFVEVALAFGLIVANEVAAPRWNEGDFFGQRFGRDSARSAIAPTHR